MKKVLLLAMGFGLLGSGSSAQLVSQRLQKAFGQFEADSQLRHAISSLYVIDANTGEVVFDKNSQVGLAGASTQKIITATTAFELLGKDYRYMTFFVFSYAYHRLCVWGTGDPTFGSWRYKETIDTNIFKKVVDSLLKKKIFVNGLAIIDNESVKNIPTGWIYEDLGNYYGAAAQNLNWHENQYDLTFYPGQKEGDLAALDTTAYSTLPWRRLINNCKTGKNGSGDNAYVYFVPSKRASVIEGTVPAGVKKFTIAATDYSPEFTFCTQFSSFECTKQGLFCDGIDDVMMMPFAKNKDIFNPKQKVDTVYVTKIPGRRDLCNFEDPIYTHYSPSLDSIVYWFLKKSINLYGEALIRTFAQTDDGIGTTDSGVNIVKKFWKEKGLDPEELNIYDGSGLSPMNRITTHAQVEILKFAKTRPWFSSFYYALPEYNGMKMKSGTIGDVKGFCGYQKSKDGHEYIFSFLVNNYNGRTSAVVNKMYKVLDELK